MKYLKIFFNGLIKENPTFVLLLGMCPTLGTTSSALNGMSMGLATTAVLICSNFIISLIKNLVPDMVRIPSFVVVIASLVTVLQMLIEAYAPAINESLGLFIPLIVVNCIILGRAEAFAAKNGAVESIFDGIGIGLGFTFALTGEAAVNPQAPDVSLPFTMCHEMAHRMCIANERDANFAAYLIALINKLKKA